MSELNPYAAPRADDAGVVPAAGPRALNLASAGTRFLNLVIDSVVRFLIAAAVQIGLATAGVGMTSLVERFGFGLLTFSVYYVAFEAAFGFTVGKLITGTRVVDEEGGRPGFGQIFGRTFVRMVPFELFSFFGTPSVGWHDEWSGTRVVKIRP